MNRKIDQNKNHWIQEVPSHWELKKIKYLFWERKELNSPIKSNNLISLTIDRGVILHSEKTGAGNKPKEDISKYKLVHPGDIVLNSMNYNLFIEVLNAKHFGLPQNRERIFIIGFKDKFSFNFPEPTFEKTRLGNILDIRNDDDYTISDRIWQSHQRRKEKARAKGYGFGYSLFDEDSEYTSTISARYYKDGSEILIKQKDQNPRMLTPREAARLQGFPEEFKIPVSNLQAYKQFGNAVPVNVIRAIAKEMILCLSSIKKTPL